jgi:ankyrin repeat protein
MISFLTAPTHRPIERQPTLPLVADNSSVIRAQSYQISIEILVIFHHFIENFNTQSLLHKMNDDKHATQQLINAINKNDTATASSLILSRSVNLNGEPWPLLHAAELGRVEIMTMLLDAGADINAVDEYQIYACHVAIWHNQFDALKLLIERGADLGVVDCYGHSLLSSVARNEKNERFAILLLDTGAPLDGLSNDELRGLVSSVAVFNRLMARGFNFTSVRNIRGATLSHYVACNVECEDDLRFLLNACGNDAVHAVDFDRHTPLHMASSDGNALAVRVLVELGADIDRQDKRGWSALHIAAANKQSSFVELLLALGADVCLVSDDGTTACHFAALLARPASLCALVGAGGDLDQPSNNGETPRMIAIRKNVALPTVDEINAARQRIAKTRLDLVRERAFQICVGLQSFRLNALQLCEILMHSFGALGSLILFHQWWAIATKVKHFRDHKQQSSTTTTSSATNNEKQ